MSATIETMGAIALFAGERKSAPRDWVLCKGQVLESKDNRSLYSLLFSTYGGDGRDTFGLPNLEDIGNCVHIMRTDGMFPEERPYALPFVKASENEEGITGMVTKTDGIVPNGWMLCDGRILQPSDYNDLYSIIANYYGGYANFALPNLNTSGGQQYIICAKGRYLAMY